MNILFIGLGKIGFNIASNLSKKKNIKVFVYNRTKSKIKNWLKNNSGIEFKNNLTSTEKFDLIISCVTNDLAINEIFFKYELFKYLDKNGSIIDHSTISYEATIKLNNFFKLKNINFYDCPVTGGQEASINGTLSTMCGGNHKNFFKIKKIIKIYSKVVEYCGPSGFGTLNKLSNQILMCNLITLTESFKFNKSNNIDFNKFYKITFDGSGSSWILKNRYNNVINNKYKNFGYSISLFHKDLTYVLNRCKINNINLEVVKLVHKKLSFLTKSNKKNYDISYFVKKFSNI